MKNRMTEKYRRVCAYVNLDAVRHNMDEMHRRLAPGTKMMGVIKTDGYGHGAVPIGRELEKLDYVFGYATATAEEALALRRAGLQKPILILGYTFPDSYEELIQNDVRFTVFRRDTLEELAACARAVGKPAVVHIKVDTGMTRIGIRPDASGLDYAAQAFHTDGLRVEGMFTHFARADERDKTSAAAQLTRFVSFTGQVEEKLHATIPIRHCSNSAGILEMPQANLDMVRAGITMYGLWPSDEVSRDTVDLQPVLSLKSHIVYCREVEAGVPVSYGGTYVTPAAMRIATVPVGYGDGYPRSLSNKGYVLIRGRRAPIVGRICMDQFMVSLDGIPDAREGDEVTLIGRDGALEITAEQLGALSGRFNYELVCDLGRRIPRVYLSEGRITAAQDSYGDCHVYP